MVTKYNFFLFTKFSYFKWRRKIKCAVNTNQQRGPQGNNSKEDIFSSLQNFTVSNEYALKCGNDVMPAVKIEILYNKEFLFLWTWVFTRYFLTSLISCILWHSYLHAFSLDTWNSAYQGNKLSYPKKVQLILF